ANAKASANVCLMPVLRADPKFELRTRAYVARLLYDRAGKKVTGVTYVDLRSGEEYEQPAGLVALCGYVFANTQLMLLAGIGAPCDAGLQLCEPQQLPRPRSDLPGRAQPAADPHDLQRHRRRAEDVDLSARCLSEDRRGDEADAHPAAAAPEALPRGPRAVDP